MTEDDKKAALIRIDELKEELRIKNIELLGEIAKIADEHNLRVHIYDSFADLNITYYNKGYSNKWLNNKILRDYGVDIEQEGMWLSSSGLC